MRFEALAGAALAITAVGCVETNEMDGAAEWEAHEGAPAGGTTGVAILISSEIKEAEGAILARRPFFLISLAPRRSTSSRTSRLDRRPRTTRAASTVAPSRSFMTGEMELPALNRSPSPREKQ